MSVIVSRLEAVNVHIFAARYSAVTVLMLTQFAAVGSPSCEGGNVVDKFFSCAGNLQSMSLKIPQNK